MRHGLRMAPYGMRLGIPDRVAWERTALGRMPLPARGESARAFACGCRYFGYGFGGCSVGAEVGREGRYDISGFAGRIAAHGATMYLRTDLHGSKLAALAKACISACTAPQPGICGKAARNAALIDELFGFDGEEELFPYAAPTETMSAEHRGEEQAFYHSVEERVLCAGSRFMRRCIGARMRLAPPINTLRMDHFPCTPF